MATSEVRHDGRGICPKTCWQRVDKTQLASLLSIDVWNDIGLERKWCRWESNPKHLVLAAIALATKLRRPADNHSAPLSFQPYVVSEIYDSNDVGCVLSTHCQAVFRRSPFPSCRSSDVALFQQPIAVFMFKNFILSIMCIFGETSAVAKRWF